MIFDFVWKINNVFSAIGLLFRKTLRWLFGLMDTKQIGASAEPVILRVDTPQNTPQNPTQTPQTAISEVKMTKETDPFKSDIAIQQAKMPQNPTTTTETAQITMVTNKTIAIPIPEVISPKTKEQPPEHTRRRFTQSIVSLISYMIATGEQPIIDFAKRSTEEQQRLFANGRVNNSGVWIITDKDKVVTFCDGIKNISNHQKGLAVDLYLWNFDKNCVDWKWDKTKAEQWHKNIRSAIDYAIEAEVK